MNSTGKMGVAKEWINFIPLPKTRTPKLSTTAVDELVGRASTGNNRFGVKIFPPQLKWWYSRLRIDVIRELRASHAVSIFYVERKDKLRQAISRVRATTTGVWGPDRTAAGPDEYDFEKIALELFSLNTGEAFWRTYLAANGVEFQHFLYEELVSDPLPFVNSVASALQVQKPSALSSRHEIMRDDVTESWVARFREEAAYSDFLSIMPRSEMPARNFRNFVSFLRGKAI